jgi:hypothetical protein
MNDVMLQATLLTRAGRLSDATTLIQRMLRGGTGPDMTMGQIEEVTSHGNKPSAVYAKADNDEEGDNRHLSMPTFAHFRGFHALHDLPYRIKRPGFRGWMQRAPVAIADIVPEGGKFIETVYANAAGSRTYKIYIPSRYHGQALPPHRHAARRYSNARRFCCWDPHESDC